MIPDPAVNIWAQTRQSLFSLYRTRAEGQAPELDCHAQAAEIYRAYHQPDEAILDAGGASGYFYWSLKKRGLNGRYQVLDQTADFLEIGRAALAHELPADRFIQASIEETPGIYDTVFCLNTLFCLPDYRQGLERLLKAAQKLLILRTTLAQTTAIRYETDQYLDPEARHLKSYFNIWALGEVISFIRSQGFATCTPVDQRTQDQPEISAGKLFPWRWVVAARKY